jgi:isoleucyl-tRNA synthetase
MSNLYLDMIKDRLYCSAPNDQLRRSAQTAMMIILEQLVLLMAPILTFTAEEIWHQLPARKTASVQLAEWPQPDPAWVDRELEQNWKNLLAVREEVTWALEQARKEKVIGGSLEASVTLWIDDPQHERLTKYRDFLPVLFIVSEINFVKGRGQAPADALKGQSFPVTILVEKSAGHKCPRCWIYTNTEKELCPRCTDVISRI